jgi:hypothetical protein
VTDRARIVGDVSADWFFALPEAATPGGLQASYLWERAIGPKLTGNAGGAALVHTLIERIASSDADRSYIVQGMSVPGSATSDPNFPGVARTFSSWRRVERRRGSSELVWRMERFLGWQSATGQNSGEKLEAVKSLSCLFIEDGNQQFRHAGQHWETLVASGADQIVLRQTGELGCGDLWNAIADQHGDQLTLICAAGDLRREGAPIGKPLSWERTAQDVVAAIRGRREFRLARRVIVLLATSGAVIVERDGASLVLFDPFHQEGDWERDRPGIGFGAGTCTVAAVVDECARHPATPDFGNAVRRGLLAARTMFDQGFEATAGAQGWSIEFPVDLVTGIISGVGPIENPIQVAEVQHSQGWRLFETAFSGSFRDAALQIALEGERAAGQEIPIERMGSWSSVDRIEIESMRSVRNIIGEYLSVSRKHRPLNLAVFGPPGSGKSFAIKQMSKELTSGGARISILEFNVSQFRSIDELPIALQRVRDHAVQETLPLVFWDEFDSALMGQELGWLVNFLAPMQDGAFIEGGNIRPIGPAIFVFAGGTHATMSSFRRRAMDLPATKATDFLSRLRGYVNILGPNPDGPTDHTYPLRRAMLLRAVLRGRAPQIFSGDELRIDRGILDAFLDVPAYYHGSRSLESIVEMSALSGSLRYERSALPALHQIALHVDAEAFMRLVEGGEVGTPDA